MPDTLSADGSASKGKPNDHHTTPQAALLSDDEIEQHFENNKSAPGRELRRLIGRSIEAAILAKLQAATPAVIDRPAGQKSGHYFKFERGEWVVFNDGEVKHYPLSGLAYSGSLTHEKRVQLDKLISDFIDGKTATPAEPAQVVADAVADEFEPGHWTVSAQRAIQEHPQYVLKLLARLKRLESEPAQAVESKLPEFFAQYEYAPDWTVLVSVYQRVPDSEPKLIHREELVSQEPKPAQAVELPDERAAFESEIGCAEKWGAQITI